LLVVDKEPGMTSHDVVARCRRLLGQRRVGHAGTLDPDATGVLLVGVGRFTRVLRFLSVLGKSYVGEVVLGVATDTLDSSGNVVGRWDMRGVGLADVRAAAATLTGAILQVPPMVSAVKVGGRRLHELAREGREVERQARPVTVERFDVQPIPGCDGTFRIEVDCSSGTYIRALAADLGAALGGGAHLRNLRRTRVGSFGVDEARPLADLGAEHLLVPTAGARDLARFDVDDRGADAVSHGLPLDRSAVEPSGAGPWAVVDRAGRLLAVYQAGSPGSLVPACVLEAASGSGSGSPVAE
jgi:tRNA pseudouridine55 synthase